MEEYEGLLTYCIADPTLTWSTMFGMMERAKRQLNIEDYSLGQTSLEQVSSFMILCSRFAVSYLIRKLTHLLFMNTVRNIFIPLTVTEVCLWKFVSISAFHIFRVKEACVWRWCLFYDILFRFSVSYLIRKLTHLLFMNTVRNIFIPLTVTEVRL